MKIATTITHIENITISSNGSESVGKKIDHIIADCLRSGEFSEDKVREIHITFSDAELEAMKMLKEDREHRPNGGMKPSRPV
jgi:hypothetical protein